MLQVSFTLQVGAAKPESFEISDPLATPNVNWIANRFGELCCDPNEQRDTALINELVEQLYPHHDKLLELAHIVHINGTCGVLIEWELDENTELTAAQRVAFRMAIPKDAPPRAQFYTTNVGTFDECWSYMAFVPVPTSREEVEAAGLALLRAAGQL